MNRRPANKPGAEAARKAAAAAAAAKRAREADLMQAIQQETAGRQSSRNRQAESAYTQAIKNKVEANWIRPARGGRYFL